MPDQTEAPIILDTHAFIWLLDGSPGLEESEFVREAERASVSGILYICSVSLAEAALLVAAGRLRLAIPSAAWLEESLATPGLQVVGIDPQLAVEGATLPGSFQGDAADRLIVATARVLGGRLATSDPALISYGAAGHVRILDVPAS